MTRGSSQAVVPFAPVFPSGAQGKSSRGVTGSAASLVGQAVPGFLSP